MQRLRGGVEDYSRYSAQGLQMGAFHWCWPCTIVYQNGSYFPPGQVETGSHPGIRTAFQHFWGCWSFSSGMTRKDYWDLCGSGMIEFGFQITLAPFWWGVRRWYKPDQYFWDDGQIRSHSLQKTASISSQKAVTEETAWGGHSRGVWHPRRHFWAIILCKYEISLANWIAFFFSR